MIQTYSYRKKENERNMRKQTTKQESNKSLNLGVPKSMVAWKQNQGFGAKVWMIIMMMIQTYSYRKKRNYRSYIGKKG